MNIHNENFEEKQESRLDYLKGKAEQKKDEAHQILDRARKMGEAIPFGQPILIGHHSEKRDRNYRDKIDNKYRKGFETLETAKYYECRVKSAELNHAIRTEDPEAVRKLKEKLQGIEKQIEEIKEHNKKCKGVIVLACFKYRDGYISISNTNGNYKQYAKILDGKLIFEGTRTPKDIKERIDGFMQTGSFQNPEVTKDTKRIEAYVLSNLNSEKNRILKRIEEIGRLEEMPDTDQTINGIRIFTDEGRVKIDFGYKPNEETRTKLKQSGFRWSPFNQTWQSFLKPHYILRAVEIIKEEKRD